MIEFITEYALWLVGNASPGHKRVFFIPVLFCCLHPFLPHCIVFLGAPWAAFPAQTWAEPPSLAAGCRQAWAPPGAAFSGNWAISGPGCSQEMRRQPWRYIFLNWTGFFFFLPPYFVAGSEWFVGAWGGRASAGGRPRLGGSVGMWMQWDVSQRPRGWKPKQWTRPGGAARLSARWLVCLILVGLFLSQNWIIQSLFGRQSSAFRGCTCGNAHLLPSQREGFQVPRSNVGPLLTLTWDSLKLTSWGLKASKCAFIFMEDVWLTP